MRTNLRVRLGDIVSVHQARPAAHGRLRLVVRVRSKVRVKLVSHREQTCAQVSGFVMSRRYGSFICSGLEAGKVNVLVSWCI